MTNQSQYMAAGAIKSRAVDPTDASGDFDRPPIEKTEHTNDALAPIKPENTDLERRVLAHERILQALIAHMAESEPKFVERLDAVFSGATQVARQEHDYTDTDAHADQFIRGIQRIDRPFEGGAPWEGASPNADLDQPQVVGDFEFIAPAVEAPEHVPVLFEVGRRANTNIWEITKDGTFYGHYFERQAALDAVHGAVLAVEARSGIADVLLRGERM